MEQVQFAVAQVLDSFTQVLRQHMSLKGRVGSWLCGRQGSCWRWRSVSDRLGREQVWCRLLTTIASHGGDHAASDVGKQLRAEIAPAVGDGRGWAQRVRIIAADQKHRDQRREIPSAGQRRLFFPALSRVPPSYALGHGTIRRYGS
jgi:hypothetical protein